MKKRVKTVTFMNSTLFWVFSLIIIWSAYQIWDFTTESLMNNDNIKAIEREFNDRIRKLEYRVGVLEINDDFLIEYLEEKENEVDRDNWDKTKRLGDRLSGNQSRISQSLRKR